MQDKTEERVALENAKFKLLNVLSCNNNALCHSSKFVFCFFTTSDPGDTTWGLWIFSAKCDVILRFRWISFNMPEVLCTFLVN